jgi:energy-coupling factor transporter transmembrane protein EcfT
MRYRTSFIPGNSPIHRLNPLTKLVILILFIVIVFSIEWIHLPILLFLLIIVLISLSGEVFKIFFKIILKLGLPLVSFVFIFQIFFYQGGEEVLWEFSILKIRLEAITFSYLLGGRILVMISSLLFFLLTTNPGHIMNSLISVGFPPTLSFIILSTLNIFPYMQSKANSILDAQKSRGLEVEGNILVKIKSIIPLIAPLLFGSISDVEQRALALEARAFSTPGLKTSILKIKDSLLQRIFRIIVLIFCLLLILYRLIIYEFFIR